MIKLLKPNEPLGLPGDTLVFAESGGNLLQYFRKVHDEAGELAFADSWLWTGTDVVGSDDKTPGEVLIAVSPDVLWDLLKRAVYDATVTDLKTKLRLEDVK